MHQFNKPLVGLGKERENTKIKIRYNTGGRGYRSHRNIKTEILEHKCDNLDEMDQLLERHNLPKFTQGKNDPSGPVSVTNTDSITTFRRETPGPDGSAGELYPPFKEEITPVLSTPCQRMEAERLPPNSPCEARTPRIPKPQKDIQRKPQVMPVRNTKILHETGANQIQQHIKRRTPTPGQTHPSHARLAQHLKTH